MSNWLSQFSSDEIQEMFDDACHAFEADQINEREFRDTLARLGKNATDIEECVKFYRPKEDG